MCVHADTSNGHSTLLNQQHLENKSQPQDAGAGLLVEIFKGGRLGSKPPSRRVQRIEWLLWCCPLLAAAAAAVSMCVAAGLVALEGLKVVKLSGCYFGWASTRHLFVLVRWLVVGFVLRRGHVAWWLQSQAWIF